MLIANGEKIDRTNHQGETPLFYVGSPEMVKWLVEKGVDINAQNIKRGHTALHNSFGEANTAFSALIKAFFENGADINLPADSGRTPLCEALLSQVNSVGEDKEEGKKMCAMLMEYGADLHILDDEGEPSFMDTESTSLKNMLKFG